MPSPIEASFLEVEGRPSIREVTKQTTSVRFQTTVSACAKGAKGVTHTKVRATVLGILGFDGLSHRCGPAFFGVRMSASFAHQESRNVRTFGHAVNLKEGKSCALPH
jgi:hypothetical protein